MRAREPDSEGQVDVDGVRLAWESFNDTAATTVLFVPIDTCVHSGAWKGQVPYLAQHFRVVTVDPPGNGRSGRALDPEAYADLAMVEHTLSVMDHLGVERAVLVGICVSAWQALLTAALHPDRVLGVAAVAPWARDSTSPYPVRLEAALRFEEELDDYSGWMGNNRHYLPEHWPDYAEFFFGQMLPEPHSTKQLEDVVGFTRQTTGDVILAEHAASRFPDTTEEAEALLRGITAPVLVVTGTADLCQPPGRAESIVAWTGAERLVLDRAGHLPMARQPVLVNRAIKSLVDRAVGVPVVPRPRRDGRRRPRLLYLSSPIGLGHVRRDLAIADAMREMHPDLEVQWLTQSPVAGFLEHRGEVVHPASRLLASESGHFEAECGEHDLHAFDAVRRMDEVLVNNFMVFDDLVERERFDLWVGDEAWDLDHFLHEHPSLKRAPFVWMTDFVGWVPMSDGGEREAFLTADYNAEMVEHVADSPGRATVRCSSATRPTWSTCPWVPASRPRGRGRSSTSTSPATSWAGARTRPAATSCASGSATVRTTWCASSPSVAREWATTCCAARSRPTPRRRHGCRACGWSWSPARGSTRARSTCRTAWRCTASSRTSTSTTRRATSPSSRAG
ncbi:Pimeloyl-ACP methyl ester carboxylesterase [Nocardioides exalbidus]|uniref:Pimeloyl-ACP methyl ester carboxylesterase n=1 Tax=Nocardioides exalbidus TaxID=402596 RepID=A0A1H4X2X6_9ACTN|nr:alpha/beta hydrolase [Nocardioides exalbidus]SED00016.1 Pimeloyl-ACP methyl ester carboxylesterase [Nocardioides exalbidus]